VIDHHEVESVQVQQQWCSLRHSATTFDYEPAMHIACVTGNGIVIWAITMVALALALVLWYGTGVCLWIGP